MLAGDAVVFRNNFGRPLPVDHISKHLACQSVADGSKVFSLITKMKYFGKPTSDYYSTVFEKFQDHFKAKTLFCSAIGCVRDLVQPQTFIRHIVNFHKSTGADVHIVSFEQTTARRPVWKGLTHQQFLLTLKAILNFLHSEIVILF